MFSYVIKHGNGKSFLNEGLDEEVIELNCGFSTSILNYGDVFIIGFTTLHGFIMVYP